MLTRFEEFDALRGGAPALIKRATRAFSALFEATMSSAASGGARRGAESGSLLKKLLSVLRHATVRAERIGAGVEGSDAERDDDADGGDFGAAGLWASGLVRERSAVRHAAQLRHVVEIGENALLRAPQRGSGAAGEHEFPGRTFIPTWLFSLVTSGSPVPLAATTSAKVGAKTNAKVGAKPHAKAGAKAEAKTEAQGKTRRGRRKTKAAAKAIDGDDNSENEESLRVSVRSRDPVA